MGMHKFGLVVQSWAAVLKVQVYSKARVHPIVRSYKFVSDNELVQTIEFDRIKQADLVCEIMVVKLAELRALSG